MAKVAEILGANLKRVRTEKGVSRRELADAVGITENLVGQYELGRKLPPLDKIFLLADSLDVAITDITGENKKAVDKKVFEYRLQQAIRMAEDAGYYPHNTDGTILIGVPVEIVTDEKTNIVTIKRGFNDIRFKNVEDFVTVMETANTNAIQNNITFNKALRNLLFEKK